MFRSLSLRASLNRAAVSAVCVASFAALSFASDTPSSGYQVANRLVNPSFGAATCTLANGELVTFDGLEVARWTPDGTFIAPIATLSGFTFPSFIKAAPDGLGVVFAESGDGSGPAGNVYYVHIDGSALTPPLPLVFPYDADFLPSGDLVVSAATLGFGNGNDFALVKFAPPSVTLIGHVDGASGPVAVSRAGDIYYATQISGGSPPPGATDIVRWPYSLVLAGTPLDASNALTIATGFDGGSSMVFDPIKGRLFLAENNFGLGVHNIWRVKTDHAHSTLIATSTDWTSQLRFANAGGSATFDAYQPEDGSRLVFDSTDFFSFNDIVTVAPLRPVLSITGPGVLGAGNVTLSVTGGAPNGCALLTYCTQSSIAPVESDMHFPKFLHHTPFDLTQTVRFNFLVPSDAAGTTNVTFYNPGGLAGLFGYQFLVGNAAGALIGSSNAVQF